MDRPGCPLCYRRDGSHSLGCPVEAYFEAWKEPAQTSLFDPVPEPASTSTFDAAAGEVEKEKAIRRAVRAVDPEWMERARKVLRALLVEKEHVTSDDLWARIEHPPVGDARAVAGVWRHAMSQGWCEDTGRKVKSERPERHRGWIPVYRSLLYSGVVQA